MIMVTNSDPLHKSGIHEFILTQINEQSGKFHEGWNTYIVSKYHPTEHLIITKAEKTTFSEKA